MVVRLYDFGDELYHLSRPQQNTLANFCKLPVTCHPWTWTTLFTCIISFATALQSALTAVKALAYVSPRTFSSHLLNFHIWVAFDFLSPMQPKFLWFQHPQYGIHNLHKIVKRIPYGIQGALCIVPQHSNSEQFNIFPTSTTTSQTLLLGAKPENLLLCRDPRKGSDLWMPPVSASFQEQETEIYGMTSERPWKSPESWLQWTASDIAPCRIVEIVGIPQKHITIRCAICYIRLWWNFCDVMAFPLVLECWCT